ncbi:MAG: hypothetical protein WB508_02905 [Aeromicrobium sp.]|uniref:hypothetical protein n=1 Tax=Aeromicrobium sp. TaxID=1871063 RepID=UPI003C5F6856
MDLENVLWMLTALAAVVVLLTYMRMSSTAAQSGHARIPQAIITSHTVVGVLALVVWIGFLSSANQWVGYAGLVLWWVEVALGVAILSRWLPGAGRHSSDATDDTWADGPGLSLLGHVGLLLGVCFFTWTVATGQLA